MKRLSGWTALIVLLAGCGLDTGVGSGSQALAADSFVDMGPTPAWGAIAIAPDGTPAMVACETEGEWPDQHSTVRYLRLQRGRWISEVVAEIGDKGLACNPRLVFDPAGRPHILAHNSTWIPDPAAGDDDEELACEASCIEECQGWGDEDCSDCNDNCEDDYLHHADAGVYYASRGARGWSVEQITDELSIESDLAIDDRGRPHVLVYPAVEHGNTFAPTPIQYYTRGERGWRGYETGFTAELYFGAYSISRMLVSNGPTPRVHLAVVEGDFETDTEMRVTYLGGIDGRWTIEATGLPITADWGPPTVSMTLGRRGSVYIAATSEELSYVTERSASGVLTALPDAEIQIQTSFAVPFFFDRCGELHLWNSDNGTGMRWNGSEWLSEAVETPGYMVFGNSDFRGNTLHTIVNFGYITDDFEDWHYVRTEFR